MAFNKFKLSKQEYKKLIKIKKIKKSKLKKKNYYKYKKKLAKQHFERPSLAPTYSRVALRQENEFEEKNGLRIPVKVLLKNLGDQLVKKEVNEYRSYRKLKRRGGGRKKSTYKNNSVVTNNIPLKRLINTEEIKYGQLYQKTESFMSFYISDVPQILFSEEKLSSVFNITKPIKIEWIMITGFFTMKGMIGTSLLLGGQMLVMVEKAPKKINNSSSIQKGEELQKITRLPDSEKLVYQEMFQYNKETNFLTTNNFKNYNNIHFRKKLYINKDSIISVAFLPIPLSAIQSFPIEFNGNVTIAFSYIKKN